MASTPASGDQENGEEVTGNTTQGRQCITEPSEDGRAEEETQGNHRIITRSGEEQERGTVESRVVDSRGGGIASGAKEGEPSLSPDAEGETLEDMEETCLRICKTLKEECKVNFLALDFDLTIVDIHTSGRWPGTPEQLAQRIRPFFQALIPVAVAQGMYLGVVTFSPQVSMISRVLKAAFPEVANQIPIRGDDCSWDYEGRGATDGKQSHMASAVEELTQTHAANITRASTLLIDDDVNNVKIALSEGVKAVWCNPKDSSTMIEELIGLGNSRDSSDSMGRCNSTLEGEGSCEDDQRHRRDDEAP